MMQRTLIGREASLEQLELSSQHTIMVVVGTAGVGKSALVQAHYDAAAEEVRWWCDLRHSSTRAELLASLATSLEALLLSQDVEQDPAEHLERLLSDHPQALLVLDNAEGCAEPLSELLESWASHGSLPRTIVTSRHRLALSHAIHLTIEGLSPQAARALFLERARAARGGSSFLSAAAEHELKTLDELMARLDYMPLAIEIFAARAWAFGLNALLDELVEVAHMRDPTSPGGHSSLADALRLSWRLLEPQALEFLRQSAIFVSSFELDAAREVIALEPGSSHMSVIAALMERSLLRRDDDPVAHKTRFAPYHSVREVLLADDPLILSDALIIRHARFITSDATYEVSRLDDAEAVEAIEALRRAEPELRRVAQEARVPIPLRLEAQRALALLRMRVGPAQALIQGLDDAVSFAQHHDLTSFEVELRVLRLRAFNLHSLADRISADTLNPNSFLGLSPTQQIDVELWSTSRLIFMGKLDQATTQLEALMQREDVTRPQRAMILTAAMVAATARGDWSMARQVDIEIEHECQLAQTTLHDRLAMLISRAVLMALSGEPEQLVELCEEQLQLVNVLRYHSVRAEILTMASRAYAQLGHIEKALSLCKEALADATRHGMRGMQTRALTFLGRELLLGLGRPQDALERLQEAHYVARYEGLEVYLFRTELSIVDVLFALGELKLAHQRLMAISHDVSLLERQDAQNVFRHRVAQLAFIEGRLSAAIQIWESISSYDNQMRAHAQLYLIAALARDGELERAEQLLEALPDVERSCAARQRRALLCLFLTPRIFRQEPLAQVLDVPIGCYERNWLIPLLLGEPLESAQDNLVALPSAAPVVVPTLTVGPNAQWIKLPDEDEPIVLERKAALARIVEGFADAWEQAPGQGLDVEQLLALGWPGEKVLPSSGANRVYVAMNNLRKLGLDPLLIRGQQGYMLSPHVQVVRVDDPID